MTKRVVLLLALKFLTLAYRKMISPIFQRDQRGFLSLFMQACCVMSHLQNERESWRKEMKARRQSFFQDLSICDKANFSSFVSMLVLVIGAWLKSISHLFQSHAKRKLFDKHQGSCVELETTFSAVRTWAPVTSKRLPAFCQTGKSRGWGTATQQKGMWHKQMAIKWAWNPASANLPPMKSRILLHSSD